MADNKADHLSSAICHKLSRWYHMNKYDNCTTPYRIMTDALKKSSAINLNGRAILEAIHE